MDSPVAAWYWRRMVMIQLPEGGALSVIKESKAAMSEAAEWRRVFLDFDSSFVNAELMSTDAEYRNFYNCANKKQLQVKVAPPDLTFANLPANSCQLVPHRSLGGDRIVIGSRPLPTPVTCTPCRKENGWRLGYRVVQGYFEVELQQSTTVEIQQGGTPCVSVGVCTSDIQPRAVRTKQVGWCKESWGLHSDDGNIYHAGGVGAPLCPYQLADLMRNHVARRLESVSEKAKFGVGDVMGCGIVALPSSEGFTRGVFYTKNGSFLGVAFIITDSRRPIYPCAGIDAHWAVRFNFGTRPYAFDVDSIGQILVQHRVSAIPTSASAADYFGASLNPNGARKGRWTAAHQAALNVILRAVKSMAWIKRRGRNIVTPFVGEHQAR
jgi:hypothetical protein